MIAALLAIALLVAAQLPIGVRLDDAQGIEPGEGLAFAQALRDGIEAVSGRRAFLDEAGGARCGKNEGCIAEVRSRTGASDVVLLQLFAAGARVRLVAERVEADGVVSQRVQADVRRAPGSLRGVAEILFPEARPPAIVTLPNIPAAEKTGNYVAAGAVGAGALATVFAVVFRVTARAARDRVATEPLSAEMIASEKSASDAQGLLSNVLFGAAAALITGGVVYLVTD